MPSSEKSQFFINSASPKIHPNPSLQKEGIKDNPPLKKGEIGGFEKSIFATIAYYDYFNYPLTIMEIYNFLINFHNCHPKRSEAESKDLARMCDPSHSREIPLRRLADRNDEKIHHNYSSNQNTKPKFLEILMTLDGSEVLKEFIRQKNGFYFLKGREGIIKERIQKKKLADEKFKKSKWILKFLSYIPFVRLLMMSGTMAKGNPYKESDVDLLIVAKAGRIWTARALLTFFALILGKYRHAGKTENRLCFNHYITDKSLAIDFGNLYKAQEYLNLIPIAGDLEIYQDFLEANRQWTENYIWFDENKIHPNPPLQKEGKFAFPLLQRGIKGDFKNNEINLRTFTPPKIILKIKYFLERILSSGLGNAAESAVKKFQIGFIEKNPLTKSPHSRIRYTDENLVFHPVLIEPEVIGRWEEKVKRIEK